jgi:hypothetical protein
MAITLHYVSPIAGEEEDGNTMSDNDTQIPDGGAADGGSQGGTPPSASAGDGAVVPDGRAQFKVFSDRFGADKAGALFASGKSLEECTTEYITELRSENEQLKAELANDGNPAGESEEEEGAGSVQFSATPENECKYSNLSKEVIAETRKYCKSQRMSEDETEKILIAKAANAAKRG